MAAPALLFQTLPPPPLLARLREATRDEHRAIEAVVPLMRGDLGRASYTAYLARTLGFVAPLEAQLVPVVEQHHLLSDATARWKANLLASDLAALGLDMPSIEALPRCEALPSVDDAATALGVLYVLEGSTLGGQVLSRWVRVALQIEGPGAAFLAGYGERTGAMWRSFSEQAEGFASKYGGVEGAVEGARATFAALRRWLAGSALG